MGYRIFRPAQQGIPQKKVATETPPETGGIGNLGVGITAGSKGMGIWNKIQKQKLENSQIFSNPSFKLDDNKNIFRPKSGVNVGRWGKRLEINPEAYDTLTNSDIIKRLSDQGIKGRDISDLMGAKHKDYKAWAHGRSTENTLSDYLNIVKEGAHDTLLGPESFTRGPLPVDINNLTSAAAKRTNEMFQGLELPGRKLPGISPRLNPNVIPTLKPTTFPLESITGNPMGGLMPPPHGKVGRGLLQTPSSPNLRTFSTKTKPYTKWGEGVRGDKGAGFFKRIGTEEGPIKRIIRGTGVGTEEGPWRTSKFGKGLKNLGTDEGFFRNISKAGGTRPVQGMWKDSVPGKVIKAFGQTKKGGGPGFWKALFPGKAAATGATAAGAGAAGAGAAANTGLLAGMGPAGWTMLALSALGGLDKKGKIFKPHTLLGKIFSDPRLKEDIKVVGKSPSGVNVYEFRYKGLEGRYRGVLADEVPWASSKDNYGHKMVDYSKVDVDFIKVG